MTELTEDAIARFWAKVVEKDGHWWWTASTNAKGYGQFAVRGVGTLKAHRVAWMLTRGELAPEARLTKAAGCEIAECVNPDHWKAGTAAEAGASGGRKAGRGRTSKTVRLNVPQSLVDALREMSERGEDIRPACLRLNLGVAVADRIRDGNAVGT